MTIIIDAEKCVGCGACAAISPGSFKLGEDGKAQVKKRGNPAEDCKLAIQTCPVGAISRVSINK